MKIGGRELSAWVNKAGPYDIVSLAIRMEQGAVRTYAALASQAGHRLTQAKFRYLAEEEREHAYILGRARKTLKRPARPSKRPFSLAEASGRPDEDRPASAVRLALRAERDAENFYRACAKRCRQGAARGMFKWLADQEAGHAAVLEAELKALSGPLPWSSMEGTVPEEEDFWV